MLTRNGSRCPACQSGHQRTVDQRRGSASQRGYGAAWAKLSAQVVAEEKCCRQCGHPGSPDNPLTTEHIRPKAHGGTDARENLMCLCRVHNSARRPNPRKC